MVPFERAFSFLVVGSSFVTCVAVIAEHSFLCSVHVVLLHLFCSITRASERINKLIKNKVCILFLTLVPYCPTLFMITMS